VSVLFADLVGFTTLSESRDAEEVRELLSRYFDTCKRLISLYGGTVEKFIGDAVMAVWGTPVAQEDDAERAVRTALDLVAAVSALGDEVGAPELKARGGVLTGEAAVTIGAEGEGMVAGDLVNTASRIQSSAEPGSVLVGESTKRSTEAAIAYEEAGSHELKGKVEPQTLFRALRVTAGRGGALKSGGLEPPFVGRERELRLVKELFHASAEENKAHLISVVGIAGIGKSRLAWEFYKYIDGLLELVRWHRGRCLAYGEGVTYWALAEMVRMRAEIVEGEETESARSKLRASLAEHVLDAEERSWIEPRLANLLGLEQQASHERDDLFAAWRLFFERMAEVQPTVLVFEDMQWADASLLEFVDYLLEWSRSHPLFVVTLARPELSERHPGFGAGRRNATMLSLEPLSERAMRELLAGFVPGLPEELRAQILERAEGVPLYAVETVRMLLDRGLLEREGEEYRPTGPIDALEVPETLHALIAARLDGLAAEERRLLQGAAVLGKTFSKEGLVALGAASSDEVEPLLAGLVRKEVLFVQADPRSPERGQYGFLQDLLKRVAYETLAKKARKAKHLAAAAYLADVFESAEQEVVEVIASHYLAAYEASPEADDAAKIKERAREMLARAGERAAALAAGEEAQHYFEQAARLADERLIEAILRERAGEMAWAAGAADLAQGHFERATALFEAEGETHPAARVSARLGEVEWSRGQLDQALARMEEAFAVLSTEEPDADFAFLAAQLARLHFFKGELGAAAERVETALEVAEAFALPQVLAEALNTASVVAINKNRPEQSLALVKHALELALEHDLTSAAFRGYNNVAETLCRRDRYEEAVDHHRSGVALARRFGDRVWEGLLLSEMTYPLVMLGRWQEADQVAAEVPEVEEIAGTRFNSILSSLAPALVAQGKPDKAAELLARFAASKDAADVQERASFAVADAALLRAKEEYDAARAAAEDAIAAMPITGVAAQDVKAGLVEALESSFASGDFDDVERLLATIEQLPAGIRPSFLRGHASRFRARLAAARGDEGAAETGFQAAAGIFREFGLPFWLAVTLLEHGELLDGEGRVDDADPLLAEAREIFERLEAKPWLERVARAGGTRVEAEATA
jgi:predicted ATPase/class 3 adenylate cyclase